MWLWRINTPETDREMYDYAISQVNAGQRYSRPVGRTYQYGRGVEKDLHLAVKWLRKVAIKILVGQKMNCLIYFDS